MTTVDLSTIKEVTTVCLQAPLIDVQVRSNPYDRDQRYVPHLIIATVFSDGEPPVVTLVGRRITNGGTVHEAFRPSRPDLWPEWVRDFTNIALDRVGIEALT